MRDLLSLSVVASRAVGKKMLKKKKPFQLFVRPLSFDMGTTRSTSQLFEYIKQCFHVSGFSLLPESTFSKGVGELLVALYAHVPHPL